MRTTFPVILVLAMALTATFFIGSGFNDLIRGDRNTGDLGESVSAVANNSTAGGDKLSTGRTGSNTGDIVGLIIGGGQRIFRIAGMVALLPITLMQLGFPAWFALPIGSVFTIIISIGMIQFITGRDWR